MYIPEARFLSLIETAGIVTTLILHVPLKMKTAPLHTVWSLLTMLKFLLFE
jgi:hypothetical protein